MSSFAMVWALALTAGGPNAGFDRVAVKRQIRHELRACYTAFLHAHPRPPGTLTVSLDVTPAGTVADLKVAGIDSVSDTCFQTQAAAWRVVNRSGASMAIQLSVPAAEIDPDSGPISVAEIRPLLEVPASATVLPLRTDHRSVNCWSVADRRCVLFNCS